MCTLICVCVHIYIHMYISHFGSNFRFVILLYFIQTAFVMPLTPIQNIYVLLKFKDKITIALYVHLTF